MTRLLSRMQDLKELHQDSPISSTQLFVLKRSQAKAMEASQTVVQARVEFEHPQGHGRDAGQDAGDGRERPLAQFRIWRSRWG